MKKRLYLVRHGETVFNVQHRIQGWCDSPLTECGIRQALYVKEYFKEHDIQPDHAYSSTSERCCDTLELITDLPYIRLKGLKEMNYGKLEAEREELASKDPKECETYYLRFGGDSSNTVRDRMLNTLTDIMNQDDHQVVLAVSHGASSFNFLRGIGWQKEKHPLKMTNAGILVLDYEEGQFKLVEYIANPITT